MHTWQDLVGNEVVTADVVLFQRVEALGGFGVAVVFVGHHLCSLFHALFEEPPHCVYGFTGNHSQPTTTEPTVLESFHGDRYVHFAPGALAALSLLGSAQRRDIDLDDAVQL